MLILIIGVDHHIQYKKEDYSVSYREKISHFLDFLREQSKIYNIDLLAEEFSEEALKMNNVSSSNVFDLSQTLKIQHCFCDPDTKQRTEYNINSSDERELFWLNTILAAKKQSIILICGDAHVDTFKNKLNLKGIDCQVIGREWGFGFELS